MNTGLKREKGYVYFITKAGNLAKAKMAKAGRKTNKKRELVAKLGIKKESGRLYYVDKNMNIGETSLVVERKRKKKKR